MIVGVVKFTVLFIIIYAVVKCIYKIHVFVNDNKNRGDKKLKYPVYTGVIVLLTILILGIFSIRVTHIKGRSMEPTIEDGQWVLENILDNHIERGDIITFYINGGEERLIKRVIATEGESVEVKDNNIYIDGEKLVEDYTTRAFQEDFKLTVVPKGEYFMMGDNRPISLDSRYEEVGTIKESQIDGSVLFID